MKNSGRHFKDNNKGRLMMSSKSAACLLILILVFVGCNDTNTMHASNEEKAVSQAAKQFYVALNAMFTGDLDQMEEVWSHEDDVTYMGPAGGIQVGWDKVLANWESQAAMKLGGEVKPGDMHITVGRDLAVLHNYVKGKNIDAEGKPRMVSIRATSLFRKEDGKWKMIGNHTDLLPFLEK
ncbi:MAG: nuclear transport factor 2 family protein [Planctomycetes bacterium]|nr:nuclear transport factor 2 family protein [Planctomycetota bacterium]